MKTKIQIENIRYGVDLSKGESIAITLFPNGEQPNHFAAPKCTSETLEMQGYIGDTKQGGSCNVKVLTLIPHCNGTHTESISHIIDEIIPVYKVISEPIFSSVLISVAAEIASSTSDNYRPSMDETNSVITRRTLEEKLREYSNSQLQGLVVRTLPNISLKKNSKYDANNYPPYFTNDAMAYLVERQIKHLLVDFPSVDKMYDQGQLTNHRIFWGVATGSTKTNDQSMINKTITEMVFIDEKIKDGIYLCNLQCPEIETDAVPSRPILHKLEIH